MMFEFPAMDTLAYNNKTSWEVWSLLRITTTRSAKFKHHRYSENVNFEETSNIISILLPWWKGDVYWSLTGHQTFKGQTEMNVDIIMCMYSARIPQLLLLLSGIKSILEKCVTKEVSVESVQLGRTCFAGAFAVCWRTRLLRTNTWKVMKHWTCLIDHRGSRVTQYA